MTWIAVIVLAVVAFAIAALLLKLPRAGWEPVGAALLLGVAGYALQANPGLPSAPRAAHEDRAMSGDAVVGARRALSSSTIPPTDQWVVIADALARNGQFGEAAAMLRGTIDRDLRNAEAWTAMGNAIVAHADGVPTPAALLAYRRAIAADAEEASPHFFLGVAEAQLGRYTSARDEWRAALALAPQDAPWRPMLAGRLDELDRFIAGQNASPAP